jgi:hypothetical protein
MADPIPQLPLPANYDLGFWTSEVDRAERVRQSHEPAWDENLRYYGGKPLTTTPEADFVNVNVDFYETEQKAAQLFFEQPDLQLAATGPLKGGEAIIQVHRELLNELLGPDQADVLRTVQKAIKDCLCGSGIGPTIIRYEPTIKTVEPPDSGDILGLRQPISVPIAERWTWERFSPWKLLIPADFKDTEYDKAPWLGMRFRMAITQARQMFDLPPEFAGTVAKDEHVAKVDDDALDESAAVESVDGTAIWYRAALYESEVTHPELYRELVLIDGLDVPARHRDSPFQSFKPGTSELTADSLIGNPIHPLTIRDLPDSAYPPSDSEMRRPLVKELCKFRTQMVQERDINQPKFGYDTEKVPPETVEKIRTGTAGSLIGFEPGVLAQGAATAFAQLAQGTSPRQTYLANDYIQRDLAKTSGLDSASLGVQSDSERSATEMSQISRAANVRLDAERRRVLDWYLKGVAKFSALVVRYMTPQRMVPMTGPQGAQTWAQWDKTQLDGRLAFRARPDSQIRADAALERRFQLQLYQMVRNDPRVTSTELLKGLFEAFGKDPTKLIVTKPPEKKPDPPAISFRFAGTDLDPLLPQFGIVLDVLRQGGVQLSPQAVGQAQLAVQMGQLGLPARGGAGTPGMPMPTTEAHGGPAQQVNPIGKHEFDQTGERSGPKT